MNSTFSEPSSPMGPVRPSTSNPPVCSCFCRANDDDVRRVLMAGYAAATILPSATRENRSGQLRLAFDGDAVIFFPTKLSGFTRSRAWRPFPIPNDWRPHDHWRRARSSGYWKGFNAFSQLTRSRENPIRTALITARSAPAHKRVILTLRAWGIRVDEALFLGGREKAPFLRRFRRRYLFR